MSPSYPIIFATLPELDIRVNFESWAFSADNLENHAKLPTCDIPSWTDWTGSNLFAALKLASQSRHSRVGKTSTNIYAGWSPAQPWLWGMLWGNAQVGSSYSPNVETKEIAVHLWWRPRTPRSQSASWGLVLGRWYSPNFHEKSRTRVCSTDRWKTLRIYHSPRRWVN